MGADEEVGRNTRKTERGAERFPTELAVRTAPFPPAHVRDEPRFKSGSHSEFLSELCAAAWPLGRTATTWRPSRFPPGRAPATVRWLPDRESQGRGL